MTKMIAATSVLPMVVAGVGAGAASKRAYDDLEHAKPMESLAIGMGMPILGVGGVVLGGALLADSFGKPALANARLAAGFLAAVGAGALAGTMWSAIAGD